VIIDFSVCHNFLGQIQIAFCTFGMDIVQEDRFSVTGGFTEPDVPWDDCLENLIFEVIFYLMGDLVGEVVSAIKHGEEDPFELELWIERLFDQADCFKKLSETFHSVIFALQRDDDGVGRCEGIDGQ
jgi:hypothetical protein